MILEVEKSDIEFMINEGFGAYFVFKKNELLSVFDNLNFVTFADKFQKLLGNTVFFFIKWYIVYQMITRMYYAVGTETFFLMAGSAYVAAKSLERRNKKGKNKKGENEK